MVMIIENDTDFRRESSPGFRFQCPCLIFEDPEYFVEYSIEHHSLWHWSVQLMLHCKSKGKIYQDI